MPKNKIEHVFILMLENHSFDNIFGASGLPGIQGIDDFEYPKYNDYNGHTYYAQKHAPSAMYADPGHEFRDTIEQLCGSVDKYKPFFSYPSINNSGFVKNFATTTTEGDPPPPQYYGDVMKCFDTPNELPIIYQLASEFAVCDNWFSSMPGPTWPNRFFAYAATSFGLDDSPNKSDMLKWCATKNGIKFPNGSIFDLLKKHKYTYKLYQDGYSALSMPMVMALDGIEDGEMQHLDELEKDLKNDFKAPLTLIEPNYGWFFDGSFKFGSSQHPMDSMEGGEKLIKRVYETIRSVKKVWEKSMLIITYDEHGGFYDSVTPPPAIPPGDTPHPGGALSRHGFLFDQYGVRVPSVVVSPYIKKNTVDHTEYDHTSMMKTVQEIWDLPSLTNRDGTANSLTPILNLDEPRQDCPRKLGPVMETESSANREALTKEMTANLDNLTLPTQGNIYGFLAVANKIKKQRTANKTAGRSATRGLEGAPADANTIMDEDTLKAIETQGDVKRYFDDILSQTNH